MVDYFDDNLSEGDGNQPFDFDELFLKIIYDDRIDFNEGTDVAKSNSSKECILCHYCYFNHGFKFQKPVRNSCHDFLMLYLNISDLTIKLLQFICWKILCLMIVGINKVHLKKLSIKNGVCNYYFDNLMKAKKLKTKNILIDEKNYNNLVIYCARFVHRRSIKM